MKKDKGLVYIGRVVNVIPVPDADKLEMVDVICGKGGRWLGIVRIGDFKEGDTCQVYLQDSLLPQTPEFEFMKKYNYRVRIQRLRGAESECLVMPQVIEGKVGDDVTMEAGVSKYRKPVPKSISGQMKGHFPSFIPRTDEPNFQKKPEMLDTLRGKPFYAAVKYDGSSGTVYYKDGELGACSRNYELKPLKEDEGGKWAHIRNAIWYVARKYNLKEALSTLQSNLAFQFEVVGHGIQGNPLKIEDDYEIRLFNVWDIDNRAYLNIEELMNIADSHDIPRAEIVTLQPKFDLSTEELRELAIGKYSESGLQREGIVVRPVHEQKVLGRRLSFKVINPLYKD